MSQIAVAAFALSTSPAGNRMPTPPPAGADRRAPSGLAAAIQGMLYATIKALADRGGARAFERVVGEWPGD